MDPIPVAYVVGNHMHWVDMEWLWGYHVLPGSVRDMLDLCRQAGVKVCVNFDGVGYEKLAVEAPEALDDLRAAIAEGIVEPVGCSYGQPYGLFHGGESNIRQRVFGVRTALRLLGARPRSFWEEEFDFFPQLPQILAGCGFTGASLFFQWTWHTPEVPIEEEPVVLWEGVDGTRLPAATRHRLNLHQWPEDMEHVFGAFAASAGSFGRAPAIVQWLELMPSPDWMCRSELILPKLRELMADARFDVRPMTLGEYLAAAGSDRPVRRYGMADVWHGMSLGKNGDRMRRLSADVESAILQAETIAASFSLFGRPYATWDVYPVWELEEAWRELLIAQHHDNDECEGLCGRVGRAHYEKAFQIALDLLAEYDRLAASRVASAEPGAWGQLVPPPPPRTSPALEGSAIRLEQASLAMDGLAAKLDPVGMTMEWGWGLPSDRLAARFEVENDTIDDRLCASIGMPQPLSVFAGGLEDGHGFWLHAVSELELEPGFGGALWVRFSIPGGFRRIWTTYPHQVCEVEGTSSGRRKYPEGDWMTSPQWFEEISGAFTGLTFVDLECVDGHGVLIAFEGARQWFRDEDGSVRLILDLYDPWDERRDLPSQTGFAMLPHGELTPADRVRLAAGWRARSVEGGVGGDIPGGFVPVVCRTPNVVPVAFYREVEDFAGRNLESYAGRGMGYPFVLRLVEFDGLDSIAEIVVAGPVARAYRTNLLGEIEAEIFPAPAPPDALGPEPEALAPFGIVPQTLRIPMRPHEIATLVLDLVPGRKQVRDLDAKREVWATVHRVE